LSISSKDEQKGGILGSRAVIRQKKKIKSEMTTTSKSEQRKQLSEHAKGREKKNESTKMEA